MRRTLLIAVPVVLTSACGLISGLDGLVVGDATVDAIMGVDAVDEDVTVDGVASDSGSDTPIFGEGGSDGPEQVDGCKTTFGPFETDAGPYCPFQGDGSTFGACGRNNQCCIPAVGTGNSFCASDTTVCVFPDASATKNADFVCNETADCPGDKPVCCLTAPGSTSVVQGCSYYIVSSEHGTTCMTDCAGQPQICGQTADCSGGQACQPLNTLAMWLGVCK